MYGYRQQHTQSDTDDECPSTDAERGSLPPLPKQPSHLRSVSKSRRRSSSFSRFFHRDRHLHDDGHVREEQYEGDATDGFVPGSYSDEEGVDGTSSVGMFSRQARSAARQSRRSGRTRSLSEPEPPSHHGLAHPPPPASSRAYEAYSVAGAGSYVAYSDDDPLSSPPSPEAGENPLFAPTLSPRQIHRLSLASSRLQSHEAQHVRKEEKRERRGEMKGLVKIAVGVMEMVGEEKREERERGKKEGRNRSRSRGRGKHGREEVHERTSVGAPPPFPTASSSVVGRSPSSAAGLSSLIQNLEYAAEGLVTSPSPSLSKGIQNRFATMDLVPAHLLHVVEAEVAARVAAITGVQPSNGSSPQISPPANAPRSASRADSTISVNEKREKPGWEKGLEGLEVAGGTAAALGLASAGAVEWWKHREAAAEQRQGHGYEDAQHTARNAGSHPAIRPSSAAAIRPPSTAQIPNRPSSAASSHPAIRLSSAASAASGVPPPLLLSLHSPLPLASQGTQKVYLSTLTPPEHHLLRHAAAALLLKDKAKGVLHVELEKAVKGIEHLVEVLEHGVERAWEKVHPPKKLFGTPLAHLTHHEGTLSSHGALGAAHPVRVPEFVDHCVTALKMMDVTTEGLFRKSGNLRVVKEIIEALDTSGSGGGKQTVIDLAALDPVTLADIFKKFLAALPDPLLTGRLFKLFIACSHIHHPGLRRRAMHLVVCLMPRVDRDVMEVVFLFLDWLSTYAHVDIKVGNQMDLSAIATVMAPTLLRPHHRAPKPVEYKQMIAAVLGLLEDQRVLHEIPYDLAHVLHLLVPPEVHKKGGSAGLVAHLAKIL
ncbi:hypothetical protein JCM11251_007639 [Rhodosporidiobolus azoricus]